MDVCVCVCMCVLVGMDGCVHVCMCVYMYVCTCGQGKAHVCSSDNEAYFQGTSIVEEERGMVRVAADKPLPSKRRESSQEIRRVPPGLCVCVCVCVYMNSRIY